MNRPVTKEAGRGLIERSILAFFLFVVHGFAQTSSFEVVSIKVNKSQSESGGIRPQGGSFSAENVTLKTLIMYGFGQPRVPMLDAQIVGEPNWAKTDRFDIEAKPAGGARVLPGSQTRAMVKSLLEDFFKLRTHSETRNLPVYSLELAKKGPNLSQDQTPPDPHQAFITVTKDAVQQGSLPRGALRFVNGSTTSILTGTAVSVPTIVMLLQGQSDRAIVDRTGFTGLIDVHLEFTKDMSAHPLDAAGNGLAGTGTLPLDQPTDPLFLAIQEIGLKFVPAKAPFEVIVIDSVQKPPEN